MEPSAPRQDSSGHETDPEHSKATPDSAGDGCPSRTGGAPDDWLDQEIDQDAFPDARLGKRFRSLLQSISARMGNPTPFACQDWAATKAAYRFFDNPRIDEGAVLSGHFAATRSRFEATSGLVHVLHDTTEFSYQRARPELIGQTKETFVGRDKEGRPQTRTVCGLLMHSSLVVTAEGLPLGMGAVKFWTRDKFKGANALRKSVNPTRMPIEEKESYRWLENVRQSTALLAEPQRCVHIADREGDIYELFSEARDLGAHFLIRASVDRMAGVEGGTVAKEMAKTEAAGVHRIEVRDRDGKARVAELQVKFARMTLHPPLGKQNRYPALELTAIHAYEENPPAGNERLEWKLLTDLPVESFQEAVEKLEWYAQRWKIETFHKILKSGCKAEESKLRTAERLTCLLSIYCIVSWRIFWLCMTNRTAPEAPADAVFTGTEIQVLAHLSPKTVSAKGMPAVADCLKAIARLGGYLARRRDPPPGNLVLWRGFKRLVDIHLGFELARNNCG